MTLNFFRTGMVALLMVFGLSFGVFAQTSPTSFPNVKIKNFGQMDEHYYRGAQPEMDDYQSLKALGVKTVNDLINDPTDYEKGTVEALGLTDRDVYTLIRNSFEASFVTPRELDAFIAKLDAYWKP